MVQLPSGITVANQPSATILADYHSHTILPDQLLRKFHSYMLFVYVEDGT